MRIADLIIQTLTQLGTRTIFSVSGNQVMPIYDAWLDSDIQLIHVRHEAAAVHMADAWGRLTGEVGVALLPAGPGFANALSATYVAKMAESPVVILSGHAPLDTLGRATFQEVDQQAMARPVSKASTIIDDIHQVSQELRAAFELARSGRPGPVHLAIPFDLLKEDAPLAKERVSAETIGQTETSATISDAVQQAIAGANRPLLIAGPAVMRHPAFASSVKKLGEIGLPLIGTDSPRGVFDPALGRFSTLLQQTDCLILLGKKLDFTLKLGDTPFFTIDTQLIQFDHEQEVLDLTRRNGKNFDILSLSQRDPAEVLRKLGTFPSQARQSWLAQVDNARQFQPTAWSEAQSEAGEPLHPAEVGQAIHDYLSDSPDNVFISDGGEFGQWMQAHVKGTHRVINGPSGSIGSALPFAVAARLAYPESKIVACSGDGAFGFHPFEFDTAVRYQIPFTLVIGNDACWNAEYQIQLRDYGPDRVGGVDLNPTPYHDVVQALGGWGAAVTDREALTDALHAAEQSQRPACLNVTIRSEAAPRL